MTSDAPDVFHLQPHGRLVFWCEGCASGHAIAFGPGEGPRWMWNGDLVKPTVTPSIRVRGVQKLTPEEYRCWQLGQPLPEPIPTCCHSFITAGSIHYLEDCTHHLKGMIVPLKPWSDQ